MLQLFVLDIKHGYFKIEKRDVALFPDIAYLKKNSDRVIIYAGRINSVPFFIRSLAYKA